MRKVLRGYAKDKHGNLILIGTTPVLFSKDKCSPATREGKSGKAQRSLRKKRFVNRPRSDTRRNWRAGRRFDARDPIEVCDQAREAGQ
jgi:hypothetical protein